MRKVHPARFQRLVAQAINSLPEELLSLLDNVEIVVEPFPTPAQLRRAGVEPPGTLLGLYEGVPRTERGGYYNLVPPDRITIFQQPIEAISRNEDEMFRHVQETILHELAHHFGFDEDHIQALEQELGWGADPL